MRYLLLLMLFVCTACSPKIPSSLTLEPLEDTSSLQRLRISSGSLEVELTFDQLLRQQYVTNVRIKNNGSATIVVDPATFRYIPGQASRTPIAAVDPKERVDSLRARYAYWQAAENSYALPDSLGDIVVAGLVEGTIHTLLGSPRTPEEREELRRLEEEDWDADRGAHLVDLQERLTFFAQAALRQKELAPGEEISGKVLFPVSPGAQNIWFYVPVAGRTAIVKMRQKR